MEPLGCAPPSSDKSKPRACRRPRLLCDNGEPSGRNPTESVLSKRSDGKPCLLGQQAEHLADVVPVLSRYRIVLKEIQNFAEHWLVREQTRNVAGKEPSRRQKPILFRLSRASARMPGAPQRPASAFSRHFRAG